ncbi:putative lipoprotein, partial [Acidovorax delafieldii 2AN]
MTLVRKMKFTLGAALLAGLAACGGGGGGDSAAGSGTLRLALTDAPSCGYDAVHVTVAKVRVHQSSSAGDADAGWSEIVLNPARRVDLLSLTNGVLMELGQIPLPTGKYTQMRLVLADNSATQPLANSVLPTGGREVALKTPSGQQSGVKTNINIDIAENKMADFVLDFDACKSVVQAGASGQYLLKPVVTVIPRYVSGVQGYVDPDLGAGATRVSLQVNGTVVKATVPDSTGKFLLQPVAPGNYTLVMAAPGRTSAVVTGVPVAAETVTPVA